MLFFFSCENGAGRPPPFLAPKRFSPGWRIVSLPSWRTGPPYFAGDSGGALLGAVEDGPILFLRIPLPGLFLPGGRETGLFGSRFQSLELRDGESRTLPPFLHLEGDVLSTFFPFQRATSDPRGFFPGGQTFFPPPHGTDSSLDPRWFRRASFFPIRERPSPSNAVALSLAG